RGGSGPCGIGRRALSRRRSPDPGARVVNGLRAAVATCVATLVAPERAFEAIGRRPRFGAVVLGIGALESLVALAQSWVVWPAIAGDPLVAGTASGAWAGATPAWILRVGLAALAPAGVALRAAALGVVLRVAAAGSPRGSTRALATLAACAEIVPWVESVG